MESPLETYILKKQFCRYPLDFKQLIQMLQKGQHSQHFFFDIGICFRDSFLPSHKMSSVGDNTQEDFQTN